MHGTAVGRHARHLNLIVHTFSVRQLGRSCFGARLFLRQGLVISGSGRGIGVRVGKGNVHSFNVGKRNETPRESTWDMRKRDGMRIG
jgi:hypothetical protein